MSEQTMREYYEENVDRMPGYKGIPMICVDGLHELVAETARRFISPGQKILDVGCGRGAFARRMHDQGFDVDACDLYDLCMCKDEVNFTCAKAEELDLKQVYDCVFMIELIEHTESPFDLIRRYGSLVKPGGYLIFTTPNVDSDISRAWFLLTGRHWYFEQHNVTGDGHIMPVHDFQVRHHLQESPLRIVDKIDGLENRSVSPGAFWGLLKLYRLYQKMKGLNSNDGTVSLYVLRKDEDGRFSEEGSVH